MVARRAVLRGGALAAVLTSLSSCTTGPEGPPPPDPLAELAESARADARAADAVAKALWDLSAPAAEIAKARGEHAAILQREVDRVRPPSTASSAPPSPVSTAPPTPDPPATVAAAREALLDALREAERRAGELVPTVPRYRAGMLGSVAAGCACLREVLG